MRARSIEQLAGLCVELTKIKLEAVYLRARRAGLARIASTLASTILDDVRLAATEELARRGLHVITHRSRPRKVA